MNIRKNDIQMAILKVYRKCDIHSFPIDCFKILNEYNIIIRPYCEIKRENPTLYKMCKNFSNDAFKLGITIYYDETKSNNRIRFSFMHELGHIVLNHDDNPTEEMEQEANIFSSNILAPRIAIHYAECRNCNDVAKLFEISLQAADIAFNDYRRWRRYIAYYKMSVADTDIYNHFYNKKQGKFIWSIQECDFCGKRLYNTNINSSHFCDVPELHIVKNSSRYSYDSPSKDFLRAEEQWLYGWL